MMNAVNGIGDTIRLLLFGPEPLDGTTKATKQKACFSQLDGPSYAVAKTRIDTQTCTLGTAASISSLSLISRFKSLSYALCPLTIRQFHALLEWDDCV